MGSFAGYSVSVCTFEIVRLFFNGFFFWCCDLMDCFSGLFFHARGPRTVHLAHTIQLFSSASRLLAWMSSFCCGLVCSFGHQKMFCFCYAWRRLVMAEEDSWCLKKPDEAFHTRRHRPWRRHQESCLVALKTPIWLSHTHFAWQTKCWLSEDVSVRFNQNLLKQFTHKYYIRLSG